MPMARSALAACAKMYLPHMELACEQCRWHSSTVWTGADGIAHTWRNAAVEFGGKTARSFRRVRDRRQLPHLPAFARDDARIPGTPLPRGLGRAAGQHHRQIQVPLRQE